jgi:heme/copper-type cytochrome/quinol oxidase subunit 2
MSDKKQGSTNTFSLFEKENFIWMIAGIVVIALGMLLMSGGKSNNPAQFNQNEVYSTTRITIAPLVIVIGLALEVVAIFKKPKSNV